MIRWVVKTFNSDRIRMLKVDYIHSLPRLQFAKNVPSMQVLILFRMSNLKKYLQVLPPDIDFHHK